MSMKNLVIVTCKIPLAHKLKLEDIARHDKVSRSSLHRAAIERLLNGRKYVLYEKPSNDQEQGE